MRMLKMLFIAFMASLNCSKSDEISQVGFIGDAVYKYTITTAHLNGESSNYHDYEYFRTFAAGAELELSNQLGETEINGWYISEFSIDHFDNNKWYWTVAFDYGGGIQRISVPITPSGQTRFRIGETGKVMEATNVALTIYSDFSERSYFYEISHEELDTLLVGIESYTILLDLVDASKKELARIIHENDLSKWRISGFSYRRLGTTDHWYWTVAMNCIESDDFIVIPFNSTGCRIGTTKE